jgi:site-specific DNA recombinase
VAHLDGWIAGLFAPEHFDERCRTLAGAAGPSDTDPARARAAERKLADCDKRLGQYRKALDSRADPAVVAGWMSEVQSERLRAEQELVVAQPRANLDEEQVRSLVRSLGDVASVLADADPALKSQLYEELGISVTYDHATRTATACAKVSVGGGT